VAANRILVATTHDGGEDRHKVEPRSGMLTEPCRSVVIQSGRWIFI
jgi:hypothetical protein